MIRELAIVNVQSHRDTFFDFHPGINVVTGPSDVGKSVVVRSLKLVARNRPGGDSLRRHKTKKTSIRLDKVTRTKTASKNEYLLNDQAYKALRGDIPTEIQQELQLTDVNFQEQHDAYFLISDTPGQVAKTLNKVADLQVIDESRTMVKSRIREAKGTKESLLVDQSMQSEKVEALSWAVEADKDYLKIETLKSKIKTIEVDRLDFLITDVRKLQGNLEKYPRTTEDLRRIEKIKSSMDIDLRLEGLINNAQESVVKIPSVDEALTALHTAIDSVKVDISIEALIARVIEAEVTIPEVSGDVTSVNEVVRRLFDPDDDLFAKIEKFHREELTVKAFPATIDCSMGDEINKVMSLANEEVAVVLLLRKCEVAERLSGEAEEDYTKGKEEYESKMAEVGACPLCGKTIGEK